MKEKKETEMKVRVGNFFVERDEDGVISIASVSKNWFVGIAAGTMTHLMLNNTILVDNPTERDITITNAVIVSMYTSCMMAYNADFVSDVFNSVERIGKIAEGGAEEDDSKAIDELRNLDDMKEENAAESLDEEVRV
jgi:hypothetical protein|nr:MAG TPA: hypothetical protein [Caudoviricetes sp.]